MRAAWLAAAALAAACSGEPHGPGGASPPPAPETDPGERISTPTPDEPAAGRLPTKAPAADRIAPGVTVRADPPPPFTYWAPPGSVIRNHASFGLWVAELNGRQVKTYFGDDCGASRLQGWIGQGVDDLPALPPVLPQRNFARDEPVTQELLPNRINVIYDPQNRRVVEVACF